MTTPKLLFVETLQANATALAKIADILPSLRAIYYGRGYNTGGANAIVDPELAPYNLTATQIANYIYAAEQFIKLVDNQVPAQGDFRTTINLVRNDM